MQSLQIPTASRLTIRPRCLLRRVLQFNFHLAQDIHPSQLHHLSSAPPECIERIRRLPRGCQRLTAALNQSTQFTTLYPDQFLRDRKLQICLFSSSSLMRLVQTLSAVLLADSICNEIRREGRIEIEQSLSAEVLDYTRHRCRLTTAPAGRELLADLRSHLADDRVCWSFRIGEMSNLVCDLLWCALPAPLRNRIQLKLPIAWGAGLTWTADVRESSGAQLVRLAERLLETEMLSDWNTCFN